MLPVNPYSNYAARAHDYATGVLSGQIVACQWVKRAAKRFFKDLDRASGGWTFRFDEARANATCTLFELFVHEKGELMNQPVRLGDWQCFIFCNIFGWLNAVTGYRRFREAFVLIPKGNGKTPMGAWVALKLAFFDGEKGAEVYNAASSEEQAREVFKVAKWIVDNVPELFGRVGIVSSPNRISQPRTNSYIRPISGSYKDGKAPQGVTNDEWHQQPDDTLYDSLKNATDKRKQPLIFDISTAGDSVDGPCFQMQENVQLILQNADDEHMGYANELLFGIVFDVDPDVPWNTLEACIMANPNFGVSMDEAATLASLEDAVRRPNKQNDFRCKRQNFWAQQMSAWMNMHAWAQCRKPIKEDDFKGIACFHGSDLASSLDLAATVKLFVREGEDGRPIYSAFTKAYLPERRIHDPARQHLQGWRIEGYLTATEGGSIDFKQIENETVSDIEAFQIRELAFDARYAEQYAQQIQARTGITITKIPPSPAELSPAMKELEGAVEDGRFEHDGNPILSWCVSNLRAKLDSVTGNYHMPSKEDPNSPKKIDCAIALLIAMARARFFITEGNSVYIDPEVFFL